MPLVDDTSSFGKVVIRVIAGVGVLIAKSYD